METSEQVNKPKVPNPKGKGGFKENPQNINAGGRPKNQESFTYWLNQFKNMTVSEIENWLKNNPKNKRTVAADLAYRRVKGAQLNLKEFKDVADRTEGKPKQTTDINLKGNMNVALVEFVGDEDSSVGDGNVENQSSDT